MTTPRISGPQPLIRFYLEETDTWITTAGVVAREALIVFMALGFCWLNLPLFLPGAFLGVVLHKYLGEPFEDIYDIFWISFKIKKVTIPIFAALFFVGAIVSYPYTWVLGSVFMGLWCGKRGVDIKNHCKGKRQVSGQLSFV